METRYRFIATSNRLGQKEVFPQNGNTLSVSYEKEDERAYFSKKLKGKLLFVSDDFRWFLTLDKSQYRCEPVSLLIQKFCNGGVSTVFIARLSFNKGDFDLDQCILNIEADELDKYTCFNDNKGTELNLIYDVINKQTINLVEGELEYTQCSGSNGDELWCGDPDDLQNGWTVLKYDQVSDSIAPPGMPQPYTFEVTFVREKINSPTPMPAPWISIGGNDYVRKPALYGYSQYAYQASEGYSYKVGGTIDNGMLAFDCFEAFLTRSCPNLTLRSEFFQWNSANPTAINYVTGTTSKVSNLILFQTSDVKRAGALNNATKAEISFEDLLNDFCRTFNCKWDITDTGFFIIEHLSFFNKTIGLDLVNRYDSRLREGTRKYSYDNDNMPRKELFTMQNSEYQLGDFAGVPIEYVNDCVGKGDKENKDYQVEHLMTDIELALRNGSPDSEVVPDEGLILVACNSANGIITEASILGGNVLNNALSWSHLHRDYWRHGRVFRSFLMNNVTTAALSTIPTKKQVKIIAKICCGESFDPDLKILTTLGTGTVADAQYNIYLETLELNLLYDAEAGLTLNNPPVANNDNVTTYQDVAIDVDVLANDTDSDGTIEVSTLNIVYAGTNGVASIVGGKIRYIPNTGYSGSDVVTYNVKDNWGELSNTGTLNILVKAGSSLPVAADDNFTTVKNTTLNVGDLLANDTGDGALSCVPETKATAHGSVQIYANGSFVYTPATDYIGDDSFDYTLKDANNNTDTGTANITVQDRVTVYVKLTEENQRTETIEEYCSGSLSIVGTQTLKDLRVSYYSDAAGTIPLDVTLYNLIVQIKEVRTGDSGSTPYYRNINADGVDDVVLNQVTAFDYNGCGLPIGVHYNSTFELNPSPNYVIIYDGLP